MSTNTAKHAIKYIFSGSIVYAIDLASFTILTVLFPELYLLSNVAGKLAGVVSGFILHKYFTFSDVDQSKETHKQGILYSLLFVGNLAISVTILYVLVDIFSLNLYFSRISTDIVIILISFVVSRAYIFKPH